MIHAATLSELIMRAGTDYSTRASHIWRPGFRALRFTYGDILRMAHRAAVLLEEAGVGKGDNVIIWAANSPYWVAAFWGCQLRGAVAVPMMLQNTPEFVARLMDITAAKAVFKSGALKLDTSIAAPVLDVERVLATAGAVSQAFTPAVVSPDDVAQILFTSGTTGNPKGVELRHRNILSNVYDVASLDILRPDDHLMSYLPLAHVFEQVVSLFLATAAGVPVTQAASLSGLHIRMNMVEDRPTIMLSVPEFLKLAVQQIESRAQREGKHGRLERLYRLPEGIPIRLKRWLARPVLRAFGGRLRLVVAGGSALDPGVGAQWESFGVMVLQGYGATETSPVVAVNRPVGRKTASVGPPMPSVQVRIAEDGEILVRGPNVVDGYYKRPEETAARFRDGWYYTDDIGEIDSDGHLHIRGRKKFLIVTPAGENVYPEDLETELNREPEVRDSAVLAIDPAGRFEIHAVVLPASGVVIDDPQAIASRVNARLQPHQRIQGISVWDAEDFPRTVTRKVRKNEVREWLDSRMGDAVPAKQFVPVGALERAVAAATGMPAEQILPESRLEADLKLDSLGRVTLVGIIEEEMGAVLDEGQIGPETTVADIREMLASRSQKEDRYDFRERPLGGCARFWRAVLQRLFVFPFIGVLAPMDVQGREKLDGVEGPVLFLPNHTSPIDGIVFKALPPRFRSRVAIAAGADVLYDRPGLSRFAGALELLANIYPFARESQVKSSLQYTGRLMDRGWSIVLFPEGKISTDGRLQQIKAGAGLLAVEMRATVVPVAICGTERVVRADAMTFVMPRRSRVTVCFGEPMSFSAGEDYAAAAARIQQAISSLLPPDRQPAPDRQP